MGRILFGLSLLLLLKQASANSCCGQTPAAFPVLAMDQSISVLASLSHLQTLGRVLQSDDFFIWNDQEREIQITQISVAATVAKSQQIYLNSSLMRGTYRDELASGSSTHLADTQLGYTYEVLPEYSYRWWRPTVYLSALVNVPTGRSIFEPQTLSEGTGVTGHNQWGLGLGVTLRKVIYPLTLTVQARSMQVFARTFETLRVSDFFDNSLVLVASYDLTWQQLTIHSGLILNHLSSRATNLSTQPSGQVENTTVNLGLQRVLTDSWTVGFTWSDQSLVGRPRNSLLNRTYALYVNFNWF